ETIERGLDLIDRNEVWRMEGDRKIMPGPTAFKLYDTFGFPLDLTQEIAGERGFEVDVPGFEHAMEEQRARSEGSKVGEAAIENVWRDVLDAVQKRSPGGVKFVGYEREEGEGKIVAIVKDGRLAIRATQGE